MLACIGVPAAVLLLGCQGAIFGKGNLFVWNGTDSEATVAIEGRTAETLSLSAHAGKLFNSAVAGSYKVVAQLADGRTHEASFELAAGKTVITNVGGQACFARTDISGMYQPGKERVVLLEAYTSRDFLALAEPIGVFPGDPPPPKRPKSVYAFQRMSEIPCDIAGQEHEARQFVRKLR